MQESILLLLEVTAMATPEAIITFEDGMDVQTLQTEALAVEIIFEDGVSLETSFSGDMTLEIIGGIGPMGLPGPKGDPGVTAELSDADIDDILGIEEEEQNA